MDHVLTLFAGRGFLGGRSSAHRIRTEAEHALSTDKNSRVILDFDLVEGVSHSFADELLSPLADLLQSKLSDRVFLTNCTEEVLEGLRSVTAMHRLPMPHVCAAAY